MPPDLEAFATRVIRRAADGDLRGAERMIVEYAEAIRADERAKVEAERNALMLALKALLADPQGSRELCQRVADDPAFMSQAFVAEYVKRRELNDDAVMRIAELEAKVGAERWVSVDERLPDPLEVVLIYPNECGPLAVRRDSFRLVGVTHWRPLPPPPTDAERKDESRG